MKSIPFSKLWNSSEKLETAKKRNAEFSPTTTKSKGNIYLIFFLIRNPEGFV